jgi:hypothetical protein
MNGMIGRSGTRSDPPDNGMRSPAGTGVLMTASRVEFPLAVGGYTGRDNGSATWNKGVLFLVESSLAQVE